MTRGGEKRPFTWAIQLDQDEEDVECICSFSVSHSFEDAARLSSLHTGSWISTSSSSVEATQPTIVEVFDESLGDIPICIHVRMRPFTDICLLVELLRVK